MPPGIGYNPNRKLAAQLPSLPQPGMNRNPTGAGGNLGSFQPQLSALGAFNNSTGYRPQQYSAIQSPIHQSIEDAGIVLPNFPAAQYRDVNRYNALTNQLAERMAGMVGPADLSLEAQILAAQRKMLQQALNAQPTSGTYFFVGGL